MSRLTTIKDAKDAIRTELAVEASTAITSPTEVEPVDDGTSTTQEENEVLIELLYDIYHNKLSASKQISVAAYLHWYAISEAVGSFFLGLVFFIVNNKTGGFDVHAGLEGRFIRSIIFSLAIYVSMKVFKVAFFNTIRQLFITCLDYQWGHAPGKYIPYRMFLWLWQTGWSIGAFIAAAAASQWFTEHTESSLQTTIPDTDYLTFFFESFLVSIFYLILAKDFIDTHSTDAVLRSMQLRNPIANYTDMATRMPGETENKFVTRSALQGKVHKEAMSTDRNNATTSNNLLAFHIVAFFILQYLSFSFLNVNALIGYCVIYSASWTNIWVQVVSHVIAIVPALVYSKCELRNRNAVMKRVNNHLNAKGYKLE